MLTEKKKTAVEHGAPEHFPEIKTGKKSKKTKTVPKATEPKKPAKKKTLYAVPEVEHKEVPKNKRKYTKKKVPGPKVEAKFATSTEREIHSKVSAMPKRKQHQWAAENHEKHPGVAIHVGAKKLLRHLKKNTAHGKRYSALIDRKLAEQTIPILLAVTREKLLANG